MGADLLSNLVTIEMGLDSESHSSPFSNDWSSVMHRYKLSLLVFFRINSLLYSTH